MEKKSPTISIPYRSYSNSPCLRGSREYEKFQSLIGLILTSMNSSMTSGVLSFQSLIGLILTVLAVIVGAAIYAFQSLIGLILTGLWAVWKP